MSDYTFHKTTDLERNSSAIQTILDIDTLAAPAKAALTGYVASLGLPPEKTQHLLWENIGVATLIQQLTLIYYLPSLGNQTPAPALRRTSTLQDKVVEMQSLESKFPKCQILIYSKNAGETNWIWLNTETIQNSGNRVNALKLVPYISQSDSFVPGRATQIGIQFIADAVSKATLPQPGDRLTISASVMMDVNPIDADSKKIIIEVNQGEVQELNSRLAALETLLQPFGAATETAAGTTGLVSGAAVGESEFLLRGDRGWQNPAAFVKMVGEKIIAGITKFSDPLTGNKSIKSTGSEDLSNITTQSQAVMFSTGGSGYFALTAAEAPANAKIIDFGLTPNGLFSIRRLNDSYNSVISTLLQFDLAHNLKLNNFTNFGGNISIKISSVSGTTTGTQGGVVNIALGVNSEKVIAIFPFVSFDANGKMPPGYKLIAGCEYECYIDENFLIFRFHPTNSSSLLSKPCSCLIVYTN